ncbi:FAD/NAD(P)-binding domain-containing protein [Violaceomyces palustris]|uniref:FAD/NAD(P)-binding domain-containing protein n=1 Tax=Violaceomyces palustris TaxID=1673888 RepID=A0ACD0NRW1_9BASI|nr:FAD/NAD(P)-binding domain-containing protein [Violaceomyces palustris]
MVTSTTTIKLAIVGAGPSGLVTAKTLLEASDKDPSFKPEITIFESEDRVGGTFRYRSYSNATLVSSKQLTCFSDFRLPLSHHDHLTLPEYVRYLEDYVSHFSLDKRCTFKFNTSVLAIRRGEGEKAPHLVRYKCHEAGAGDVELEESFTHLCVCSGLHVTPAIPEIPGLPPTMTWEQAVKAAKDQQVTSKDKGEELSQAEREDGSEQNSSSAEGIIVLHSSSFKDRSLYSGRKVLIMGTGETGMDMAHEAVKGGAKEIILCTRSGFLMFPAVLADFVVLGSKFDGNLPIDGLITNLFETAYVHPWVAASHLRWFVSDFVIKRVLWALTGTEAGCNQWVGELEPERLGRAFTFLNKSSKAMPYINRGWKNRPWLFEKLASYLDPPSVLPEEPSVDLAPFPHHFRKDGSVSFVKNGRKEYYRMKGRKVQPDVVVYATGYQQNFEFLGKEYPVPATVSCRDVLDPSDPTVSFIGFVRPGVGAIPPIAEMQAQLWTLILRGKLEPPTSTPHYYLLVKESARIKYGVDYSSYVSQLAKDMGSAPSLSELWWRHGLFVTLIYCFGAAFPTFYRLVGPYEHPQAAEISRTELYDTIKRRGVIGNLMMGVIPMAFYALINLFALILEKSLAIPIYVMRVLTSSKRARPVVVTQTQGRPFTDSSRRRDAHNGARNRGRGMGEGEGDPDDGPEQEKYRQSKLGKTMLRLFALIVGVLTLASAPAIVQANTEISNFGPVLCRADHYGHLANRAADQMSANW